MFFGADKTRVIVGHFSVGFGFDETIIVRSFQYDETHRIHLEIVDEEKSDAHSLSAPDETGRLDRNVKWQRSLVLDILKQRLRHIISKCI
jgi:hypothetical protein